MKARILVVEDNVDNMTLIQDVLGAIGYDAILSKNGEEALIAAAEHHPDLILMDLSLPKMDGWTATRHLKANPALKHIPVIALTAHAMTGDRDRALQAGCDDYVTKPISIAELKVKLTHYLDRKPADTP